MSRPVVLWNSRRSTVSDDAGTTIVKSVLPPANVPGPYEFQSSSSTFYYIPSLTYFATKRLVEYPDQIDVGCARIHYQPPFSSSEFDLLRALMPGFHDPESDFSLKKVDPRLWAVIVQVFSNLPVELRVYPIPLSDKYLPLLQRVPSTPDFCLITVLEIPGCKELTDNNVLELKGLHGLCALDASATALSGFGVKSLSNTLLYGDEAFSKDGNNATREKRGPWRLRILRLKDCKKVDNTVFSALPAFPLLSVVDLRGTKCIPNNSVAQAYRPGSKKELYYPTPICTSLAFLSSYSSTLFSSAEHFTLHITSLHHIPQPRTSACFPPTLAMQDVYAVFTPPNGSGLATTIKAEPPNVKSSPLYKSSARSHVKIGNSNTLARQIEWQQKEATYARNSEAYRRRMERLGENWLGDQYSSSGGGHYCAMDCEDEGDSHDNDALEEDSQDSDGEDDEEESDEEGDKDEEDEDAVEHDIMNEDMAPCVDNDKVAEETDSLSDFSHSSSIDPNVAEPSQTFTGDLASPDTAIALPEVPFLGSGFNRSVGIDTSQVIPPFAKPLIAITRPDSSTNHRDVAVPSVVPDPTTSPTTEGQMTISCETLSYQQDQSCDPASTLAIGAAVGKAPNISERAANNRPQSNNSLNCGEQVLSRSVTQNTQGFPTPSASETTPRKVLTTGNRKSYNLKRIPIIPAHDNTKRRRIDQLPGRKWGATFDNEAGSLRQVGLLTDAQSSQGSRAGRYFWPSWDSADRDCERSPHGSTHSNSNDYSAIDLDTNQSQSSPTQDSTRSVIRNPPPPKSAHRSRTTIPRISPPSLPSSMSFELQDSIAETVTSEHNSREAAEAFYRPLSGMDRRRAQARATQRETSRVQVHDEWFMLYKEPPAWNTLETRNPIRAKKVESNARPSDVAVLNGTSVKGRKGIQALAEVIDRKRKAPAATPPNSSTIPVIVSKNPFRRKSEPGPRQPLDKGLPPTTAALVLYPVKPLVPISTLSVPTLPQELRNDTKAETASRPCLNSRTSRKEHSVDVQMLKRSSSNQAPGEVSGPQKSVKVKVCQVETRVTLHKNSNKHAGSFDWKNWAK